MEELEQKAYDNFIERVQQGVADELNLRERASLGAIYAQTVFVDNCKNIAAKSESGEMSDAQAVAELRGMTMALTRIQEEIKELYNQV